MDLHAEWKRNYRRPMTRHMLELTENVTRVEIFSWYTTRKDTEERRNFSRLTMRRSLFLPSFIRVEAVWPALVLLFILVVATVLRVWGMDYGLPHPTARPDEERIVGRAMQILATGNFHPGDYTYPGLLKYLNTSALALYAAAGKLQGRYEKLADFLFDAVVLRPGLQYRICRALSVFLGVATVAATYLLGRDAYQERLVGLTASAVVATALIHVRDSRFATVDTAMTLFITLSLLFAVRVARRYRTVDFVLAGLFAGLATATKYNAGLVILGVCFACLPALIGRARPKGVSNRKTIVAQVALSGAIMTAVFIASTPYSLLHYMGVLKELREIRNLLYDGTSPRAIWVHLKVTFPEGLGWPLFLSSVGGVLRAIWLRRPSDLVLLAFFVPSFATTAGVRWVFPRYVIPYIPILAVLASEFCFSAVSLRKIKAALVVAIALAGPGVLKSVEFDRVASQKDTRVLAAEWIAEHVPARSEVLLCRGYGAPAINSDRRRPPAFAPRQIDCAPEAVETSEARYVITHDHPSLHPYSGITVAMRRFLEQNAQARVRFDPFKKGRQNEPFFYVGDAFYLPISGFDAMERGGPILTVWELDTD